MEGPIIGGQQFVSWESRGPSKSPTSPTVQRKSDAAAGGSADGLETGQLPRPVFFSPSEHKFAASPAPITPGNDILYWMGHVLTQMQGMCSLHPHVQMARYLHPPKWAKLTNS
jgi:hypothetical protein